MRQLARAGTKQVAALDFVNSVYQTCASRFARSEGTAKRSAWLPKPGIGRLLITARLLATLSCSLLLASCATSDAQRERERLRAALVAVAREGTACAERIAVAPKYALLRQKLAISTTALPTNEQLATKSDRVLR